MIFQDNVIKEYLKNVLFITGTPCGGKTTISRELAKRHDLLLYDVDEQFEKHQKLSELTSQPAMNKQFADANEFFGRTVEEYKQWLLDNTREQMDFILLDLIRLSEKQKVVCDCHLNFEQAAKLTEPSRVVFLIREPSNLVEEYCNRPDHQGFRDFIHSAWDVEGAKATCSATLQSLNERLYREVKTSEYCWIERTSTSTVEDTVAKVEQHFGLVQRAFNKNTLEIKKVEKGTPLAEELITFIEDFYWEVVKEHTLCMLRSWRFTDWESMFVALVDGQIVGMASILKTDYYPLSEIYPWVSSVFVQEAFRGHRISEVLINAINDYAKELGFSRTYIPSVHEGLYEKFGYEYLQDIVNYGGGTDRLYAREL